MPQVRLLDSGGDVGQVKGRGRRVDVGVVLGAGLLEPVQVGRRVVLRQAGVGLTLLGQLDVGVLARHHPDRFVPQLGFVQVGHRLK